MQTNFNIEHIQYTWVSIGLKTELNKNNTISTVDQENKTEQLIHK